MDEVMEEYISKLDFGPVTEYGDLTVIPIFSPLNGPQYLTMKEAMEQNLLVITEVDEAGSVGELLVKNLADIPVLLLDGEEIMGAKQNRVLNSTILVGAREEISITVSCTEQGRWDYKSRCFSDSDVIAAHRVRMNKSVSVMDSLKYDGTYRSNQSGVWNDIHQMSMEANLSSTTGAMKDVYKSRETDLSKYVDAFPYMDKQKGIMVLINGEIAGLEAVSSESSYKLLHDKLLRSYALDAILSNTPGKHDEEAAQLARKFLDRTKKTEESKYKSVGQGCDRRFTGDKLIGSSLTVDDKVIHITFFNLAK